MTANDRHDIRPDLTAALDAAWAALGGPGTWWTGAERIAIAAETRHAAGCALCAARRQTLSPYGVAGDHGTLGQLPAPAVEAIHRIKTDAGRLSEAWYQRVIGEGLGEGAYVELLSVVAIVTAIDTFHRGLGLPPRTLPAARSGAPSRIAPAGAKPGLGWMPMLAPEDRRPEDPDLYRNRIGGNVQRAMSLVPAAMIQFWDMFETMYLENPAMRDFGREYRAISHAQIEMLAARVAALNQCLY